MKYSYFYETPVGKLWIAEEDDAITDLSFSRIHNSEERETRLIRRAAEQIGEYFSGARHTFNLPLHTAGTPFQQSVWNALTAIPFGETCSYKDIAIAVGNEKACRAVGMANNKNPIVIIVPCHRVVGANGSLVGYGGGLDLKHALLDFEKRCKFDL